MGEPVGPADKIHYPMNTSQLPSVESAGTESLAAIRRSLTNLSPQQWAKSKNEKGMTPLAKAIEAHTPASNKMDIIAYLVEECDADPKIGDNDNWTPLYRASTGTRSDATLYLLDHGAEVNVQNIDGSTPLHRAVDRGAQADVELFLNRGAEVNVVNCVGTPISYAAKHGHTAIAAMLLDKDADPNLVNDPLELTPLALAANNRREDTRQLLISRNGQEVIPLDSKVHTSLSRLIHEGNEQAILQSFANGEQDEYGRSAAHYCAALGRLDLLKQMLGKNIDSPDKKGRTPLHYAIIHGQEQAAQYLIGEEANCSLESHDKQGYTPLMWACQYNRESIAQHVLEKAQAQNKLKSILETRDNFGWQAIHKAAQVGNVGLVHIFVEKYNIHPADKTTDGRTPLDLANATKAEAVIGYLKTRLSSSLNDTIKKV